jgi:hypothetical protein
MFDLLASIINALSRGNKYCLATYDSPLEGGQTPISQTLRSGNIKNMRE